VTLQKQLHSIDIGLTLIGTYSKTLCVRNCFLVLHTFDFKRI